MTPTDRIAEYLFRAGGKGFCDDCLSTTLDVTLQEAREAAVALAEEGWSKRSERPCAACSGHKLVSRRHPSSFAA